MKRVATLLVGLLTLGFTGKAEVAATPAGMASSFIMNKGQWERSVLFLVQKSRMNTWITADGVTYDFYRIHAPSSRTFPPTPHEALETPARKGHVIRFKWANPKARAVGETPLKAYHNYFIGKDPKRWRARVPLFEAVKVKDIFEGVDARFYDDEGMVRYDLIVRPYAAVSNIRLKVEGANEVKVDPHTGDLLIETSLGTIRHQGLRVYQPANGKEVEIAGKFKVNGDVIGFEVGEYDPARPLIIDPLVYSTFIGHSANEAAKDLVVNSAGEAYITGYTESAGYPATVGAYDVSHNGGLDVFVTKLNAAGSSLVFSTFVGGTANEEGTSLVLDGSGDVYVCGWTSSSNFPTINAYDNSYNGDSDVFAFKLKDDGTQLLYSTFIGGTAKDLAWALKVSGSGEAVVTGFTASSNYPTAGSPYDNSHNGGNDVFLTRLNSTGNSLIYSTFLGGSGDDRAFDVVLDGSDNPYVVGYTSSSNFPTTAGAYDQTYGGLYDGFITKFNNTAGSLTYSTFLGGSNADIIWSAALTSTNEIVVTGATLSTNFPTANAFQSNHAGGTADATLTKLNSTGSALQFSTYFGGSGWDESYSVVLDAIGNAYTTGYTTSTNFDVTASGYDQTYNGGNDGFIFRLNHPGNTSAYGSYLGGTQDDELWRGILLGGGDFIVAGYSFSTNYPTVAGSYDVTHNGARDAVVTKLGGPLIPVSLVYFKGSCTNNVVTFHWATASERNTRRFIIEKQLEDKTWQPVAEVAAAGTSTEWKEYFYALPDKQPEGRAYYRLVEEDFDGQRGVFDPIVVTCDETKNDIRVYPNPSAGAFWIASPSNEYTRAHLYDAAGRSWGYAKLPAAGQPVRLMAPHAPAGPYFLVLSGTQGSITIPVTIHK